MILSPSVDIVFRNSGYDMERIVGTINDLGYEAFEFWGWWNKDIAEIERLIGRYNVKVGSFCTRMVTLLDPACRDVYIEGLKESLEVAARLGCTYLITQTGNTRSDASIEAQRSSLLDGLKTCVPLLEQAGVTLLVEPLNVKVNHPGYFLSSSPEAFDLIGQADSPYVKVLYDVYHQQITEGDLTPTITAHLDRIGYFHIADHPGRHEPGTGEIAYPFVLDTVRKSGYAGYVGLEFTPTGTPEQALSACRRLFVGQVTGAPLAAGRNGLHKRNIAARRVHIHEQNATVYGGRHARRSGRPSPASVPHRDCGRRDAVDRFEPQAAGMDTGRFRVL